MSNYTNEVIFRAETAARIEYWKIKKTGDGTSEAYGDPYQNKLVLGIIPKIDIGPDKTFVLWFANLSDDMIDVKFSSKIKAYHTTTRRR